MPHVSYTKIFILINLWVPTKIQIIHLINRLAYCGADHRLPVKGFMISRPCTKLKVNSVGQANILNTDLLKWFPAN